jgi:invasion protein IalB
VINTEAAFTFTIGYGQFLALKKTQNVKLDVNTANKQQFKFSIELTAFKGIV